MHIFNKTHFVKVLTDTTMCVYIYIFDSQNQSMASPEQIRVELWVSTNGHQKKGNLTTSRDLFKECASTFFQNAKEGCLIKKTSI